MKIFSISDIHASDKNNLGYDFLLSFTSRCLGEVDLDYVVFLGDIFDHMVGEHHQYFEKYEAFFDLLDQLVKKRKVIFIEGNHDFHLKNIFWNRYGDSLIYLTDLFELRDGENIIYFTHGDQIDLDDFNYKIFRSIIRSNFLNLLSSCVLSFSFVEKIGKLLTKNSKKYWSDNLNSNRILSKYRYYIECFYENYQFDFLILGHSHVKDKFDHLKFTSINNGFSVRENCFICYKNGKLTFEKLLST